MDLEIDGRLADVVERLARLRREAWTTRRSTTLLGVMSVITDLHNFVLEATSEQIRKDRTP